MNFYVSIITFILGASYLKITKKFNHLNFILVTGLSLWVIYLINYSVIDYGLLSIMIQVIKNILLSLLDVVHTFLLNKEWDNAIYYSSDILVNIANLWHLILFFLAPILTFSTIIKYITEKFFLVHLKFSFRKTLNIFYKDSQDHQTVLQSIANEKPLEKNIVSNFSGEKEDVFNTIYSDYPILKFKDIIKKHKKNYYFLDGNLESLEESINLVESYGDTDSDDLLFVKDYQSLMVNHVQANPRDDSQFKIRIVDNDKFSLYHYFYENAELLAKTFRSETILIIGSNYRALELMKMFLWLEQSTDIPLSIVYLYEDEKGKNEILSEMPAIFNDDSYEQSYNINLLKADNHVYSNISEVMSAHQVSTVFSVSEDNFYNLNIYDFLRKNFGHSLEIFIALDSEFVYKTLKPNKNFNIISFFSNDFIFNNLLNSSSQLENEALAFHTMYQDQFIEKNFYNNPYNYYSSMARALGHKYLNKNLSKQGQQHAEHNRWSMYLKSEGWSYAPKRDNLNKQHHLLIPYEQLSGSEKIKDNN